MLVRARRRLISDRIFAWAREALPRMSETEEEALKAGEVWWDAELFSGRPDLAHLLATPAPRLTAKERAFLEGPLAELMERLDDWEIQWRHRDLPPGIWAFLKKHRFFGMIVPEEFGGLGFSAWAHSEVIKRLSTRSLAAAVTVMVPNSLGPGELLLQFGTEEQRRRHLPRLADGSEIPCFGLTSAEAGSDAAAMIDRAVVVEEEVDGERVLGMRASWSKRYITLGPVATLLGVALKLYDPDRLLGGEEDLGITLVLVPSDAPGVTTGRRHIPAMQWFQNGPIEGENVFLPLDEAIIGGRARAGHGWRMLMSALAAGRGVSLPSLSTAATCASARTSGSYARVREQFGIPIARFEGVQLKLAHIAGIAYRLEAARRLTCAGLDQGRRLSVISAIVKATSTNEMREAVSAAMDIHAGKAIIDGPLNYLGNLWRAVPVGITVEGANILTRNLIIFGQGAIRCHPHLLAEMEALEEPDEEAARAAFDAALAGHLVHILATQGRALWHNWTAGQFARVPVRGPARRHARALMRYAAAFAYVGELALITLGGELKRREMLSARLGDVLSELYMVSAVIKRFEDDGRPEVDRPLLDWCCAQSFGRIEKRLAGVLRNFPVRPVSWLGALTLGPWRGRKGAGDRLARKVAELISEPTAARDRLSEGVHRGAGDDGMARLERAFDLVVAAEPSRRRMREAGIEDPRAALARAVITEREADQLTEMMEAVDRAIEVDSFAPEDISVRTRREEAAE
ncbi:MAG TPA: acyl-CoA dehydrogenase [Thermohalobaculum sp.]|nr:acyl-CoA dehydrogenase [Thermohalobaculum sp.]